MKVKALMAKSAGARLETTEVDLGRLRDEDVEVAVQYCGICHSDLALIHNDFGITQYPLVPGHEVVGKVVAAGPQAKRVKVGDTVGVGWYSASCMKCQQCLSGNHNLCPDAEETMIGRYGGFATRVRSHWAWATPLPDGLDASKAGPLFCGGITVFNPMVQFGIKPTDRVGVIGIGGLGHLALQFLNKWGCEVFAFTSSDSKAAEAKGLGAHQAVNSKDEKQLAAIKGALNFILVTANADLNWGLYLGCLSPKGRLHFVGVPPGPVATSVFPLIESQKSISGSPLGSPATTATMLEFAGRHGIQAVTEAFPMSQANEALAHLEAGKARYRLVLKNDLV